MIQSEQRLFDSYFVNKLKMRETHLFGFLETLAVTSVVVEGQWNLSGAEPTVEHFLRSHWCQSEIPFDNCRPECHRF